MKVGLNFDGGEAATWRADDDDAAGMLRLGRLRDSVGMEVFPDDGSAVCRIVPPGAFDCAGGIGVPQHGMRIDFRHAADTGAQLAFADPDVPEAELELVRWRGVRKLLFLGLVPGMMSGRLSMVHGALLARDGRALLLCGPSGIGKSTTAQRMSKDFEVLADDCFLLRRDADGTYRARPLPTWSVYIFGKEQCVRCDARRELPVSRLLVLGRSEERYTALDPRMALLGCANAFTDMVKWHTLRFPEKLTEALNDRALAAAERLVRELPCGALQLTLECDISRLLPEDR